MPGICVVATVPDAAAIPSSLELVGGARALDASHGAGVSAVLMGTGPGLREATDELHRHGVATVYRCAHPLLTSGQVDAFLLATEQVLRAATPQVVLIRADTVGRELAPRLAVRLGAALVTECVELAAENGAIVARRQTYGGRALATLVVTRRPAVLSVKPHSLEVPEPAPVPGRVEDVAVSIDADTLPARVCEVLREEAEVGLDDAQVVVSGGRGVGGPEGFALLKELAAVLGGAVGASRPPADEGWVPISWQIGQTGKTVRPALYIAVAISGATQHVAGMSGSRTIVAINRDPNAPIFSVAHLGIVGDYRAIVPPLVARIKELKGP
ncbi:MAG: electron transfer flavoprotein subunit alpha/FixB family protein [Armatimonadetes bacterium]|nr:electron transfer flavoprotein subunit alpha/FixB family protein [Armatimonadota bacterium]